MAFMQMKRLGDERARRKGFENVFDRFDKNKNGSMYVKDFLKELDRLNIKIGQEELDEINRISDSTGKITKGEFEKHCHHSEVYKALDKNRDGTIASHELESKAEIAFKALDRDKDGFITKKEFMMMNKAMTPTQVKRMMKRFDDNGDGKLDLEEFQRFMGPKKKEDRRGSGSDVGGRRGSVEPSPSSRRGSVTKIQIGGHKE